MPVQRYQGKFFNGRKRLNFKSIAGKSANFASQTSFNQKPGRFLGLIVLAEDRIFLLTGYFCLLLPGGKSQAGANTP